MVIIHPDACTGQEEGELEEEGAVYHSVTWCKRLKEKENSIWNIKRIWSRVKKLSKIKKERQTGYETHALCLSWINYTVDETGPFKNVDLFSLYNKAEMRERRPKCAFPAPRLPLWDYMNLWGKWRTHSHTSIHTKDHRYILGRLRTRGQTARPEKPALKIQ